MFSNKEDLKQALLRAMIAGDDKTVQEILNEGAAIFGPEILSEVFKEIEEEANAHPEAAQTSSNAEEAMIASDERDDESDESDEGYASDESEKLQEILERVAGKLPECLSSAFEQAVKEANAHPKAAQTSSSAAAEPDGHQTLAGEDSDAGSDSDSGF